ncbi:hypothetical protein [Maribellus sediminis]|uniref:hypothetical protein n=1 Tax=Maribellus sediminis TaxID=2696285 RepID=UPI001431B9EA|nr:hypothetical protein [Maribellus sediminis]
MMINDLRSSLKNEIHIEAKNTTEITTKLVARSSQHEAQITIEDLRSGLKDKIRFEIKNTTEINNMLVTRGSRLVAQSHHTPFNFPKGAGTVGGFSSASWRTGGSAGAGSNVNDEYRLQIEDFRSDLINRIRIESKDITVKDNELVAQNINSFSPQNGKRTVANTLKQSSAYET